jgi:hypothetical protein
MKTTWDFPPVDELPIHDGMPDPFVKSDGSRVTSIEQWPAQRAHLKAMLAHYLYGEMPPRAQDFDLKRLTSKPAFGDAAVEEGYAVTLQRSGQQATFHFETIRPVGRKRLATIVKNCRWGFANPEERGMKTVGYDRDAAREAVGRGYMLCKFLRGDVAADSPNNRDTGVLPLYPEYDWGTIAAWAWAHGVVIDALDRMELADMSRLAVTGHSRGGKAALCAGHLR